MEKPTFVQASKCELGMYAFGFSGRVERSSRAAFHSFPDIRQESQPVGFDTTDELMLLSGLRCIKIPCHFKAALWGRSERIAMTAISSTAEIRTETLP